MKYNYKKMMEDIKNMLENKKCHVPSLRNGLTIRVDNYKIDDELSEKELRSIEAYKKLLIIAREYNDWEKQEDWIDWSNYNQDKHYVYFSIEEFKSMIAGVENRANIYFKRLSNLKDCIEKHKGLWLDYFMVKV